MGRSAGGFFLPKIAGAAQPELTHGFNFHILLLRIGQNKIKQLNPLTFYDKLQV